MNNRKYPWIFLLVIPISGCSPDLVPVVTNLCPSGPYAQFSVRNQGAGDAMASRAKVEVSFSGVSQTVPTPALKAGQSADLQVPVAITGPFGRLCEHDCRLDITVDSQQQVNESVETNNELKGVPCPR